MQIQVHLALSQIKDLLRKRKYKAALSKTQRIIKSPEIHMYSVDNFFKLMMYELSAVNRLIQRNLVKKYKYEWKIIEWLIQIVVRNMGGLHQILVDIIQENGQKVPLRNSQEEITVGFPLVKEVEKANRMKLQKIEHVFRKEEITRTRKYVEKFMQMANNCLVGMVQMSLLYRKQISWRNIEYWVNIPSNAFITLKGRLSNVKLTLLFGKLLSLDPQTLPQAQNILDQSTQQLIDCLHTINKSCYKSQQNEQKHLKYKNLQKQCYKLLLIDLIILNKNNMKLQNSQKSIYGCQMIKELTKKLNQKEYVYFRRLLQPQIYLLQQYQRYIVQKKELKEIVMLYFEDLLNKQSFFSEKSKNMQIGSCVYNKYQKINDEISTVRTISNKNFKRKGNSSISTGYRNHSNDSVNSKQMGDTIITKMIVSHIEELNSKYSNAINNIGNGSYYKSIRHKHAIVDKRECSTLKRNKISVIRNEEMTERDERVRQQQIKSRRQTQTAKMRLKNRKQLALLLPSTKSHNQTSQPIAHQFQKELTTAKQKYIITKTEQNSFQQQQQQPKYKYLNITKKSKIFLQILFINKQNLGLKKIVQKFQLLKKKQEQKQKMMSNRIPSAINRDRTQVFRNLQNFRFIAQELMKIHQNRVTASSKKINQENQKKKVLATSYSLGQDSIQAIKSKLEVRIDQQQGYCHISDRNEEIFKQKLKRLGSSNFFLKRVPSENMVKQGSSQSRKSSHVQFGPVQFLDLPLDSK